MHLYPVLHGLGSHGAAVDKNKLITFFISFQKCFLQNSSHLQVSYPFIEQVMSLLI